jgi:hypothetical protein
MWRLFWAAGLSGSPGAVRHFRRAFSVIVPVSFVGRVPVPVVEVVGVVLVRHRDVAALRPVLVGVAVMRHVPAFAAFVHVVAVDAVNVTVMRVVGVVIVRESDVTAVRTVRVLVAGVRRVLSRIWHGCDLLAGARCIVH